MDLKSPRRPASAEGPPGLLSLTAFWAPLAQRKRRCRLPGEPKRRVFSGGKPPLVWKEIQAGWGLQEGRGEVDPRGRRSGEPFIL